MKQKRINSNCSAVCIAIPGELLELIDAAAMSMSLSRSSYITQILYREFDESSRQGELTFAKSVVSTLSSESVSVDQEDKG